MNTAQIEWARTRIRSAAIVNGKYELDVQRETNMGNLLFIPGLTSPVAEIRQLLFGQGQPGGSWIPTLSSAMIAANSFGSGVTDILDLSGRNNPFSQATPSSRGAWFREPKTGRRNLLERTEDLTNAYWRTVGATVASAAVTPPVGIPAAFRVQETAVNSEHRWENNTSVLAIQSGTTYTITLFSKAQERTRVRIGFDNFSNIPGRAFFDLSAGTVYNTAVGTTASIEDIGNGWYRCRVTATATSTTTTRLEVALVNTDTTVIYLGDTANGLLLTAPQAELGSTPTAYQRVTTAFDITEAGQRDCFGVRADGIDDFYQRAIDFSGTNKVTVFAAVRKLSDAALGTIAENNTADGLAAGVFQVRSNIGTIEFGSRGSLITAPQTSAPAVSPITLIATGIGDISGDLAQLRVNGVQESESTADQGSGNYGNRPLYLFSRGGTSLPFNGNLYALIVAGGSYPLSTIQRVERILSRITPTVNL
jgi:hypothetical protein